MKRLLIVACVLLAAACGSQSPDNGNRNGTSNLRSYDVRLPDGRTVVCVAYPAGGVDCDWGNGQ